MAINHKIRDKRLQYDINREATKISSSAKIIKIIIWKIDKYESLTGEEVLSSNQREIQKKLSLHILRQEKFLKNKQKRLKSKDKDK